MNLVMKEGWLTLDLIYRSGEERWLFHKDKPDYVDSYFDVDSKEQPGRCKRIIYCEADDATVERARNE